LTVFGEKKFPAPPPPAIYVFIAKQKKGAGLPNTSKAFRVTSGIELFTGSLITLRMCK